eukprot:25594_1
MVSISYNQFVEFMIVSIVTWYICTSVDWGLHTLSHYNYDVNWIKAMHDIHMNHHKRQYPIGELLKKPPYLSGDGQKAFVPPVIIIQFICCMVFTCIGISKYGNFIFVVESFMYLYCSDYMHQSYHIDGCWMEKYEWFTKRRYFHFYHHYHMNMNMSLGGFDSTVDRIMKTYDDKYTNDLK